MKTPGIIGIAVLAALLAACGQPAASVEPEFVYELEAATQFEKEPTASEKEILAETRMVERLQATIELFESVDKAVINAVINIDSSSEAEKEIEVLITQVPGAQLTEAQKAGIVNIVSDSIGGDLTVTLNVKEE